MDPILDTLTVEQALQQYREDYALLSSQFQDYREAKEMEIQDLKDSIQHVLEANERLAQMLKDRRDVDADGSSL